MERSSMNHSVAKRRQIERESISEDRLHLMLFSAALGPLLLTVVLLLVI